MIHLHPCTGSPDRRAPPPTETAMPDHPDPFAPRAPDPQPDAAALEPHLRKFEKELATGTVALVLLAVLARATTPLYGYQIAKSLERDAGDAFAGKQSALYPVLRNLGGGGLLASEVEPSTAGPPRRYYRITPLGHAVLAAWRQRWTTTRRAVDAILQGSHA